MRSLLLIPANRDKDIENAFDHGADCLVFDLAQTATAADMPLARQRVLAALYQARQIARPPLLYVRVSCLQTGYVDADLDAIMPGRPDGLILPHSQDGADVQHVSVKLAVREAEYGLGDGATKIIASVAATPASIFHLSSHIGASQRLAGLISGTADLAEALEVETRNLPDGTLIPPLALAQSLVLFAAKAAGILAIDAPSSAGSGDAALWRDCKAARRDGFVAKVARTQHEVAIINAVFGKEDMAKS